VIFGVRSEAVGLVHGEGAADQHGLVLVREPLGDETIYQIDIGNRTLLAKTSPRQVFQQGERVGIRIDQTRVHLFDPDTEQSLLGDAVAV
jgi:multiple sugar transport system ATP-binding protein